MRVLVLFPRFGIGGIAKASTFVANSLNEYGHEVLCVSMSDDDNFQTFNPGIRTAYIPYEVKGVITRTRKFCFLFSLRKVLAKERIECVVALGTDIARIATLASAYMNIRIVASERGNPFRYSVKEKKKYIKALKKCERIVFQTEEAMAFFPEEIRNKGTIIPNPCYIKGDSISAKSDLSEKVILVVSRISEEKNVLGIVKAFEKASSEISDYSLLIYGDGDKKEEIKSYVRQNMVENVIFYNNTPDPFREHNNASLYVINSFTEGMPNSLIEAMAYGIPCIATDCPPGGVRFLSDKGRRACLVPVNDDHALAMAMVKVIKESDYRNRLIDASQEITAVLDPKLISKKWVSIIDEPFAIS